jgi:hypothetical protein
LTSEGPTPHGVLSSNVTAGCFLSLVQRLKPQKQASQKFLKWKRLSADPTNGSVSNVEPELPGSVLRYLTLADIALSLPDKKPKVKGHRVNSMAENHSRLKVAKYDPLIFECVQCGLRFDASGKSGEEVTTELEKHIRQEHPPERKAA